MKYDPIVTTKDSDLAEATRIMIRNRISGIPVIDLHNNLPPCIINTVSCSTSVCLLFVFYPRWL
jgi:predicted transcriptional regulator